MKTIFNRTAGSPINYHTESKKPSLIKRLLENKRFRYVEQNYMLQ